MIRPKPLKMLVLSLTGLCNFNCAYCYAAEHAQDFMDADIALQAIDLAAAGKEPFVLQFSGGEPLLAFSTIQACINHVKRHKLPAIMQLQTNGALMTPEMALLFKQAKVGVGISLDGRPDCNDVLRTLPGGGPTSSLIINGAKTLAAHGVEIGITCVVTANNVNRLDEIIEMAYFLGNVRRIGFDLLRGLGRGCGVEPAKAEELSHGLKKARLAAFSLAKLTGKKLLISQVERVATLRQGKMDGFGHCHAMNGEAAFVDAQGRIYACSSLVGCADFCLGDVRSGICASRQEAIMRTIQRSMAFCRKCDSFGLCGGGCFARWFGSGCKGPYDVECALKKGAIDWQEDQMEV